MTGFLHEGPFTVHADGIVRDASGRTVANFGRDTAYAHELALALTHTPDDLLRRHSVRIVEWLRTVLKERADERSEREFWASYYAA